MIKIKNPLKKQPSPKKAKKSSERKLPEITTLNSLSTIIKLRLAVGVIFLLMTISFILAITSEFAFSVGLIIIVYLGLIVLLAKLFLIKHI